MVVGSHIAYRCEECDTRFTKPKGFGESWNHAPNPLTQAAKKLLGLITCPNCGSRKVVEDRGIRM